MGLAHGVTTKWQATKGVVQNGLVLNVDAAVKESYDSGTTWYDLVKNNNGSIVNGPVYDKEKGGKFILDGTNDYIGFGQTSLSTQGPATIDVWGSWSATNGARNLAALTSSGGYTQIGTRTNGVVWKQGGTALVTYTTPTVGQLAKAAGATVTGMVRFEVGEGIEKEEVDFAEEVMAQARGSN